MLSFAHAAAHAFVNWTTPPLLDAYGASVSLAKIDIIDPMLITFPPPRFTSSGYAARDTMKTPVRFTSITPFHSSRLRSWGSLRTFTPELLTTMSNPPNCSTQLAIAASTAALSVTSQLRPMARAPAASSSATAPAVLSGLRAATATLAPARANPSAMPLPIPPFPPVTSATFPSRSNGPLAICFWTSLRTPGNTCELAGLTRYARLHGGPHYACPQKTPDYAPPGTPSG